jgi:hypothetical protein
MVFKDDCTQLILTTFPEFKESSRWKEHLEFWNGSKAGIGNEMAVFGRFVADLIHEDVPPSVLEEFFSFIEMLMAEGDSIVKDIAATCFLENLLNYHSAGRIDALKFTHLLGPESRAYCKSWDEFTGVITPGV